MSTTNLKLTNGGYLSIPQRTRERFGIRDTPHCMIQAIGNHLQVVIRPEEEDDVRFLLPLKRWRTSNGEQRAVNKNGVYIGRFEEVIEAEEFDVVAEYERGVFR